MGNVIVGEKIECCRCVLIGDCWHGEAMGRLTRAGILRDWSGVYIWLSLVGSKLEVGTKIREAVSY